jgi:hypothetical protein
MTTPTAAAKLVRFMHQPWTNWSAAQGYYLAGGLLLEIVGLFSYCRGKNCNAVEQRRPQRHASRSQHARLAMDFTSILSQYVDRNVSTSSTGAPQHFDQVAHTAPSEVVASGIAAAFRADETPPFADMVGRLFDNSSAQQRASLLNELADSLAPGWLAGQSRSPLVQMLRRVSDSRAAVTSEQAVAVSAQQVQEVVRDAEKQSPAIIDSVSQFYALHPGVVKTLGAAALTIALTRMAQHIKMAEHAQP